MKIILSRKGFDSTAGGYASPILPDGTMLSIPIPDTTSKAIAFDDLQWSDISYADIMHDLPARKSIDLHGKTGHLDPDINMNAWRSIPKGWSPAFGQIGASQSLLRKAGVGPGDIFLFFGWFRQTEQRVNGGLRYSPERNAGKNLNVIFGYMEIGSVITDAKEISRYSWHPHSAIERIDKRNNALYLPTDELSLIPELPGYGVLSFDEKRVLTEFGRPRSIWKDFPFLEPENLIAPKKKNSAKSGGVQYAGQWQELVFRGTPDMIEWTKTIIQ